mgnify:CR=1 FL=1
MTIDYRDKAIDLDFYDNRGTLLLHHLATDTVIELPTPIGGTGGIKALAEALASGDWEPSKGDARVFKRRENDDNDEYKVYRGERLDLRRLCPIDRLGGYKDGIIRLNDCINQLQMLMLGSGETSAVYRDGQLYKTTTPSPPIRQGDDDHSYEIYRIPQELHDSPERTIKNYVISQSVMPARVDA